MMELCVRSHHRQITPKFDGSRGFSRCETNGAHVHDDGALRALAPSSNHTQIRGVPRFQLFGGSAGGRLLGERLEALAACSPERSGRAKPA